MIPACCGEFPAKVDSGEHTALYRCLVCGRAIMIEKPCGRCSCATDAGPVIDQELPKL